MSGLLGQRTLTVTRHAAGAYGSDGAWADGGAPTTFELVCSVQPITPELIETDEPGARVSARFVLYAELDQPEVYTVDIADQRRPDRVAYAGEDYMLQSVGNWESDDGGWPHREYVMLLVGDDE